MWIRFYIKCLLDRPVILRPAKKLLLAAPHSFDEAPFQRLMQGSGGLADRFNFETACGILFPRVEGSVRSHGFHYRGRVGFMSASFPQRHGFPSFEAPEVSLIAESVMIKGTRPSMYQHNQLACSTKDLEGAGS